MKSPHSSKTAANSEAGFTIIELLIATVVFSLILMVIILGVLSFTHAYYRGVNSSTTQDTARNAVSSIAQAIEFSGNTVSASSVPDGNGVSYFCAGGNTFVYALGVRFDSSQPPSLPGNPGLYMIPNGGSCTQPTTLKNGSELLGNNMRLAVFSVQPVASQPRTFSIQLRLLYGTDDLLCAPTAIPGSCSNNTLYTTRDFKTSDVTCKLQTGLQFCSVASLNTMATLRVANSALTN